MAWHNVICSPEIKGLFDHWRVLELLGQACTSADLAARQLQPGLDADVKHSSSPSRLPATCSKQQKVITLSCQHCLCYA